MNEGDWDDVAIHEDGTVTKSKAKLIKLKVSPLVIAADQLAQAAEASRILIIKMRDLLITSKIVELDPESKSNTVNWLDTALANYKRVREG
jgi:hypothetical protein